MSARRVDRVAAIKIVKVHRKRCKPFQRRVEETHGAAQRAALAVVICGGELNETLIEIDEVVFGFEPEMFPAFMSFPEFAGVEVIHARGEFVSHSRASHAATSRTWLP